MTPAKRETTLAPCTDPSWKEVCTRLLTLYVDGY